MSDAAARTGQPPAAIVYRSEVRVTPAAGAIKLVHLPQEAEPVPMGLHGAIAAHYKVPDGAFTPRAATLDYVVGAAAGCLLGTLARALKVRDIASDAAHLSMDAAGEIEADEGVLVIRRIRVTAHLRARPAQRETAERVFAVFAPHCPTYRTLRKAMDFTFALDFQPDESA